MHPLAIALLALTGDIGTIDETIQEVAVDAPKTEVGLAVQPGIEQVKVAGALSIVIDGKARVDLQNRFEAKVVDRAIQLSARDITTTFPGEYALTIPLEAQKGTDTLRQKVVARLHVPHGGVRQPAMAIFHRSLGLASEGWIVGPQVQIFESTRRTPLTGITISDVTESSARSEGRMTKRTVPDTIQRGQGGLLELASEGPFRPGTSRGKLSITATQLSEPVTLEYEVRARYPDWYIFPIFVVAGGLGWLVRDRLRKKTLLGESRVAAEETRERVTAARQRLPKETRLTDLAKVDGLEPETTIDTRLGDALTKLDASLGDTRLERIIEATQTAEKALSDAGAWRARLANGVLVVVASRLRLLETRWALPPEIAIRELAGAWRKLRNAVVNDDLVAAESIMAKEGSDSIESLARALATAAGSWTEDIIVSLEKLSKERWPSSVRPWLEGETAKLVTTFTVARNAARDPSTVCEELLPILDSANRNGSDFTSGLERRLDAIATELGVPSPSIAALKGAAAAANSLSEMVKESLTNQFPNFRDPAAVARALESGDYAAAFKAARPAADPRNIGAPLPQAAELRTIGNTVLNAVMASVAGNHAAAVSELHQVFMIARSEVAVPTRRVKASQELAIVRGITAVLAGALMSFIAWALYRDVWVGSVKDVVVIVATGFAANFTTEGIAEAFGKVKA